MLKILSGRDDPLERFQVRITTQLVESGLLQDGGPCTEVINGKTIKRLAQKVGQEFEESKFASATGISRSVAMSTQVLPVQLNLQSG